MLTSDSTTYSIYRIVCFATGKVYVGQTSNVARRRYEHFAALRANKHFNKYLQFAFNKYGEGLFYFEVIESEIPSDVVNEREKHWVAYYPYRFNMTDGGEQRNHIRKPCTWNGVLYKSIKEAAQSNGVTQTAMQRRIRYGYTSEVDMPKKPQKCAWNGVHYDSIDDAAIVTGITKRTMTMYLRRGYTCDEDVPGTGGSKQITWDGVTYKTMLDAAAALGVHPYTLTYRIRYGYLSTADVPGNADHLKQECSWNNRVYDSITEAAKANGYAKNTLARYIKRGFSCDNDVLVADLRIKPCTWNGVEYTSIQECAEANGTSHEAMRHRVALGYTCDGDLKNHQK